MESRLCEGSEALGLSNTCVHASVTLPKETPLDDNTDLVLIVRVDNSLAALTKGISDLLDDGLWQRVSRGALTGDGKTSIQSNTAREPNTQLPGHA